MEYSGVEKPLEQEEGIKSEIIETQSDVFKRERLLKTSFEGVDFGYNTSLISPYQKGIFKKIEERFENEDSSRVVLLKNPQIQIFLARLISSYAKDWDKDNLKTTDKKNSNTETVYDENEQINDNSIAENGEEYELLPETWEEYKLHELIPENFEEFLLSDEGIRILKDEIDTHIDNDGNFYENFRISERNLRIKLTQAWYNSVYREYNRKTNDLADDDTIEINRMGNVVVNLIDAAVGKHLKSGGKDFNRLMIENIESSLANGNNSEHIKKIYENQELKDQFEVFLIENIKKYYNIVVKNNKVSLNTGDDQIDLQLKSYLYIYGKFFYPDIFKSNQTESFYESTLLKIMKAILVFDGKIQDLEYNEFVERMRRSEEERKKREEIRRQRIARKNWELNNRSQKPVQQESLEYDNNLGTKSLDLTNATGAEIAASANLGKELDDYNLDYDKSEHKDQWIKETSFDIAWDDFINSHDNIKSIITKEQMRDIFDFETNSINRGEWENFKENNPLFDGMSQEAIKQIYNTLNNFSSIWDDTITKLNNNSTNKKTKITETVKTYAIGAVIDNVRDSFSIINEEENGDFKGFKLNEKEPVKKIGNNVVIFGSYNGTEIKVRYDLNSGKLFVNSLFHRLSPTKITIGDNGSIDHYIGAIKPFNEILNETYRLPTQGNKSDKPVPTRMGNYQGKSETKTDNYENIDGGLTVDGGHNFGKIESIPQNPQSHESTEIRDRNKDIKKVLHSQLDLISDNVKEFMEVQATQNSVIESFMKTFNIMRSSGNNSTFDFNKGSNLFTFLEIIERTGSDKGNGLQALNHFNNNFMPTIMEYSGLKWGQENKVQDKKNEYSRKIFDNDEANDDAIYLRDKIGHFNPDQFKITANFDSHYQLDFVDLIIEKLLDKSKSKLDMSEMKAFVKSIETNVSDEDIDTDSMLDEKLNEF